MQYVGVLVAFILIMYLSARKVSLAKVMFLATTIIALTTGIGVGKIASTTWHALTAKETLELTAAVLAIGLFSTMMRELGFLEKTVAGLSSLLGNVKAAIMAVPALVGTMPVLGGAALSAPLVDKLGGSLDMSPQSMAASNMVFRHALYLVFPFSPSLIMATNLSGLKMTSIIGRLWPTSVLFCVAGYFTHLRGAKPRRVEHAVAGDETAATSSSTPDPDIGETGRSFGRGWGFIQFTKYGGPLIAALLLGLTLKWPLWLALTAGMVIAFALGLWEKQPLPTLVTLAKGAKIEQALAMLGIMAFKEFVAISPVFPALVEKATSVGIYPQLLAIVLPLMLGFVSGSQDTSVGVLLPILVPLAAPEAVRLAYVGVFFSASFAGYFFSPLHLCQILTCQYFKVDFTKLYRLNWPVMASLAGAIATYFMLSLRVAG